MKIQEMAFVLLALVLLAMIGFVFILRISQQKLIQSSEDLKEQTTISLLEKIANTPELNCFCKPSCRLNCIDSDKAGFFKSIPISEQNVIFQRLSNVTIIPIYPSSSSIPVYYSGKPSNASSYSTFINLCSYEKSGDYNYNCGVAMIVAKGA